MDTAQSPAGGSPLPQVDDSIPDDARSGYDDTDSPPPPRRRSLARTYPSAEDVLTCIRRFLNIGEHPPGSNCNDISEWYGQGCVAWCAETVSKACMDAGFHDDIGNWEMPGIDPTTAKGFAYVPALRAAFQNAGRFDSSDSSPLPGDIVIVGDAEHTGMVEFVGADGIIHTIEGNYSDNCLRNRRTMASISGFCHPPYGQEQANGPAWSRYLALANPDMTGDDIRMFQQRLAERGWQIVVDGDFGPATNEVVVKFQAEKGLAVDGIVGPDTWYAAWHTPVT